MAYHPNGIEFSLSENASDISGSQSAYFCLNIRNHAGFARGIALGYHSHNVYLINGYNPATSTWESIKP